MLNEYIEQNYTAIIDLFADYTQGDEYAELELCSEKEDERRQFAERLQAAIDTGGNGRDASKLIDGFSEVCYYAELTGFILGFRKAAALFRESGTVRL